MARPPKPKALHLIHGTARKGRMEKRAGELQLKPGTLGACPAWVCPEGREEWKRLTTDKEYSEVLAPVMRGTLIDYACLHGRMIRSEMGLPAWVGGEELKPLTKPDGTVETPPVEHFSGNDRKVLHSLRMQLGLTPSSQSKVKVSKPVERENAFAGF